MSAALGGLTAFLFDPKLGADRRERLKSLWQDNRDAAVQARQTATRAFESARPVAQRVTKAVGRGDWAQMIAPRRRSATLPKLLGAAAIGGALMYFLDPVRGSERRRNMMVTGRRAVDKVVEVAKTIPDRIGSSATDAESGVKSRVG
jgi:gas vesicle protein